MYLIEIYTVAGKRTKTPSIDGNKYYRRQDECDWKGQDYQKGRSYNTPWQEEWIDCNDPDLDKQYQGDRKQPENEQKFP